MNEGTHIKPKMRGQEASWHETMAGHRAAEAAREQGANPAAVGAVATATAGPVNVGGYLIHPASQGTVWTLQRAARMFETWADARGMAASPDPENPGSREMLELGLTTLVFMDPRGIWRAMEAGEFENVIAEAQAIIWDMPLATSMGLKRQFEKEMETIRRVAGEEDSPQPKKLPEAAGPSPAMQTPPPDQASPPSSGWPLNTGFPLPQPSGTPR